MEQSGQLTGISRFSDAMNLLWKHSRWGWCLMFAVFLMWKEITRSLINLPGHQQARRSTMDLTLILSHFSGLRWFMKSVKHSFPLGKCCERFWTRLCWGPCASACEAALRGWNNKDAYQHGEEEPQHRGTGMFLQGFTAVFSHSQNVNSMLLRVSPIPSLGHIYFSLCFLEEPLCPSVLSIYSTFHWFSCLGFCSSGAEAPVMVVTMAL